MRMNRRELLQMTLAAAATATLAPGSVNANPVPVISAPDGPDRWYPERDRIPRSGEDCFDANPVHIIHEVLTDREYGVGLPVRMIDDPSFRAAADILHEESCGLSILWPEHQSAEEFLHEVLEHCGGAIDFDAQTQRMSMHLERQL